ncbi:MAG: hypothetical protein AAF914_04235 [Pseudomonadota bacterium]
MEAARTVALGPLIDAVGLELVETAELLRRAERAMTCTGAPQDAQGLDLAIQLMDDLAPLLQRISGVVPDTSTLDLATTLEGVRLARLHARLAGQTPDTAQSGSVDMF